MKVLVTIANYGTKNDNYLARLLHEYRSMPHSTHVVVITNISKDLGPDVEVVVHQPSGDPWSFPFIHKNILADRVDDYDLFIYSEDDTLITALNIDAFLRVNEVLPENEIAGFIRSENLPSGERSFSTVHSHFHWDPHSVRRRGPYTFAYFSNEHSACYLLSQSQLRRAITSGGFLVPPHQGKYDLLVTAATDPYTQCGMQKLLCISHLDNFVIPHLPNRYVGQLGLSESKLLIQLHALRCVYDKQIPCSVLMNCESKVSKARWSKSYYEPARPDLKALIPHGVHSILSYGCGAGAMEAEIIKDGIEVTAVPLDSVVAASAQMSGVDIVYPDCNGQLPALAGRRFDCVLLSNILHMTAEPADLLRYLSEFLKPEGRVIIVVPNLGQVTTTWRRFRANPEYVELGDFKRTGVHATCTRTLRKWLVESGLKIDTLAYWLPPRARPADRLSAGVLRSWLAEEILCLAGKC
jgi:2-polyprenyl-3-methyl-5-hydroxy-6-metoxy-1,4-benzoquinol methylase